MRKMNKRGEELTPIQLFGIGRLVMLALIFIIGTVLIYQTIKIISPPPNPNMIAVNTVAHAIEVGSYNFDQLQSKNIVVIPVSVKFDDKYFIAGFHFKDTPVDLTAYRVEANQRLETELKATNSRQQQIIDIIKDIPNSSRLEFYNKGISDVLEAYAAASGRFQTKTPGWWNAVIEAIPYIGSSAPSQAAFDKSTKLSKASNRMISTLNDLSDADPLFKDAAQLTYLSAISARSANELSSAIQSRTADTATWGYRAAWTIDIGATIATFGQGFIQTQLAKRAANIAVERAASKVVQAMFIKEIQIGVEAAEETVSLVKLWENLQSARQVLQNGVPKAGVFLRTLRNIEQGVQTYAIVAGNMYAVTSLLASSQEADCANMKAYGTIIVDPKDVPLMILNDNKQLRTLYVVLQKVSDKTFVVRFFDDTVELQDLLDRDTVSDEALTKYLDSATTVNNGKGTLSKITEFCLYQRPTIV